MSSAGLQQRSRLRAAFLWLQSAAVLRALGALGAVYGLLAVAGGALASHALRARLPAERYAILQTAIDYQFWHALVLVALAGWAGRGARSIWLGGAACCFALGTLLFSGSLWCAVLFELRAMLAPFGGTLLMAGWLLTAIGMLTHER